MKMFPWCPKKNPDAVKALKIHKTFLISLALDSEAGFYFLLLAGTCVYKTRQALFYKWNQERLFHSQLEFLSRHEFKAFNI